MFRILTCLTLLFTASTAHAESYKQTFFCDSADKKVQLSGHYPMIENSELSQLKLEIRGKTVFSYDSKADSDAKVALLLPQTGRVISLQSESARISGVITTHDYGDNSYSSFTSNASLIVHHLGTTKKEAWLLSCAFDTVTVN